jgi:hypothetical protein
LEKRRYRMKNIAEKIESIQPVLEYCVVVERRDGQWTVATSSGRYAAKPAVSCLVRPEKNDIVLTSIDHEGCCYILSILKRPDQGKRPTTLSLEGSAGIEVSHGALRVFADDGIAFTTPEKLAMTSEDLEINALRGEASIERMTFLGGVFNGRIQKIKVIAHAMDSVVRRAVQRFVSSYRYVEEHEEIQSGSTRMIVDGTLTMQTKDTMHIAEGHVKIDAGQIHLG